MNIKLTINTKRKIGNVYVVIGNSTYTLYKNSNTTIENEYNIPVTSDQWVDLFNKFPNVLNWSHLAEKTKLNASTLRQRYKFDRKHDNNIPKFPYGNIQRRRKK